EGAVGAAVRQALGAERPDDERRQEPAPTGVLSPTRPCASRSFGAPTGASPEMPDTGARRLARRSPIRDEPAVNEPGGPTADRPLFQGIHPVWKLVTHSRERLKAGNVSTRRTRSYRPDCKPLEDRRLLSVSLSGNGPPAHPVGSP